MKVRSVGCEVACFQDDSERFARETWCFPANCYRSGWRGWAPSAFAKSLHISVLINQLLSLIRTVYLFNAANHVLKVVMIHGGDFIYTFQSSFSYTSSILDSSWVNILKSCRIYSLSNHFTFIIMFFDMLCCCTNWSLSICPHLFESTSKDNWDDNIQPIGLSVQLLFSF